MIILLSCLSFNIVKPCLESWAWREAKGNLKESWVLTILLKGSLIKNYNVMDFKRWAMLKNITGFKCLP